MSITKVGSDIFLDNQENTGFSGSGVKTTFEDEISQEPEDEKYFTVGQLNLDSQVPLNFGQDYLRIHCLGDFANLDFGDPIWHPYKMSVKDFGEKFFPSAIFKSPTDYRVVPNKYESADPTKIIINQFFAISPWKFSNIYHHPMRFTRDITLNLQGTNTPISKIWLTFQFLLTFSQGHMPIVSEVLVESNYYDVTATGSQGQYSFPIVNMADIEFNPDDTWQYFDAIKFIHTPISLSLPNMTYDFSPDKSESISSIVDSNWSVDVEDSQNLPWLDVNFGPGLLLSLLRMVASNTPINAAYSYLFSMFWLQEPIEPQEKK
jgi:hypothetical protein